MTKAFCVPPCGNVAIPMPPYPPFWDGSGGGSTPIDPNAVALTCPTIPSTAVCGSPALTVRVIGQNFPDPAVLKLDNVVQTNTRISASELNFSLTPAAAAKTSTITVDGATGTCQFTHTAAPILTVNCPTVPATAVAGSAPLQVTVNGTKFTATTVPTLDGVDQTPIGTPTATQLKFNVDPTLETAARTATIGARDGANTAVTTCPFTFTAVAVAPVLIDVNPQWLEIGLPPHNVQIVGENFVATSVVCYNGVAQPTVFSSATELSVMTPRAGAVRIEQVTVKTGTLISNALPLNWVLKPVLTTMVPNTVGRDDVVSPHVIAFNGTGFTVDSKVVCPPDEWATTFVSATQLTATVLTNDSGRYDANGSFSMRVRTGTDVPTIISQPDLIFGVWSNPTLGSLTPNTAPAGATAPTVEFRTSAPAGVAATKCWVDSGAGWVHVPHTQQGTSSVMLLPMPPSATPKTVQVTITTGHSTGPDNSIEVVVPPLSLPFTFT